MKPMIKAQLKKIFPDAKILFKNSNSSHIYYEVEQENGKSREIRVEVDYEDHDWWVQEFKGDEWYNIDIISL